MSEQTEGCVAQESWVEQQEVLFQSEIDFMIRWDFKRCWKSRVSLSVRKNEQIMMNMNQNLKYLTFNDKWVSKVS
jgi:hypothetical protein